MSEPEIRDILAIHALLALYGHIIDAAEWHRLDELFTADLVFDSRGFAGGGLTDSRAALQAVWTHPDTRHPLAHHATNIVIMALDGTRAEVLSKGIGVGRKGRVGSVTYRDELRKTAEGWRIAHRTAVPRS